MGVWLRRDRELINIARRVLFAVLLLAVAFYGTPSAGAQDQPEQEVAASLTFVDGLPDHNLNVFIDGERVIRRARFGSFYTGMTLSEGKHKITIREVGQKRKSKPLARLRVNVKDATPQTVVAHLTESGGIKLFKRKVNDGFVNREARLTVRHLAAAPPISLSYDSEIKYRSVANRKSRTDIVPALPFTLGVSTDSGQAILDPVQVSLSPNTATVVYVVGDLEAGTLRTILHAYVTAPEP